MNIAAALAGALVVLVAAEAFDIYDWLTCRDREARFKQLKAEQRERLWNTRPDL